MSVDQSPAGVIHDIGYRRYTGPRLGRGYAVRSLYVHGLRTAFGLGRSIKAKIFPWLVIGIFGLTAAIVAAANSQMKERALTYAQFPEVLTVVIVLFCAVVAPELVSRDLRSGVLPLYFSRPLSRYDYALAKLAALCSAVWLPLAGGQLLMFAGTAFGVPDLAAFWTEVGDLLPALAYSAVHALVFAGVSLLVASSPDAARWPPRWWWPCSW